MAALCESEGGDVRLDVRLENGTVWLTQQQMSLLYGKSTSTVNEHIGDIFSDEELSPEACRKKFGNSEFQQKAPFCYNLDMILAVGFRVRSRNGVLFRKWAGEQLLIGPGSVSHEQAMGKATEEYKKYQQRTLSEVEKAYLDTIKMLEDKSKSHPR